MPRWAGAAALLLLACFRGGASAEGLAVGPGFREERLGPRLSILEDPESLLGPGEALSPERASSYRRVDATTINLGYSRSSFWLKGSLRNEGDRELRCLLVLKEPAIESVELFWEGAALRSGASVPPSERAMRGRENLFRIILPPRSERVLLLRARTDTSINLSFFLYEEDAYRSREAAEDFFNCLCLGALVFAALYNGFLALTLRDAAYAAYAVVVAGILWNRLLVLGYFQLYLTPGSGRLNYILILLSTSLFTAAMSFFTTRFLSTRTRSPFLHRLNLALPACVAANMALLAIDAHVADQASIFLLLAAALVSISTGIAALARGYRPARYYLLAWAALCVIAVIHSLGLFRLLPYSMYSDESTLLGTAVMSFLMSLALADRISEMRVLSMTDKLTRIGNRARLEIELERMLAPGGSEERPFSIIMADIDHFKQVNDEHGHQAGDEVLAEIARLLASGTRASDRVGRWGGEEFLVLCEDTGREGAIAAAEKLRRRVEERVFPDIGRITCSFGVATYEQGQDREALFRRADEALYRAKRGGRNRVEG